MPYINKQCRQHIDLLVSDINNPGVLNYVITKIVHKYIQDFGLRYQVLNEVIGVLECAKLELYRTIAAPYENIKKVENGSVSELDKEKK